MLWRNYNNNIYYYKSFTSIQKVNRSQTNQCHFMFLWKNSPSFTEFHISSIFLCGQSSKLWYFFTLQKSGMYSENLRNSNPKSRIYEITSAKSANYSQHRYFGSYAENY
ncbi:hypothetical protein J6590_006945 [Homalodisca vitripennis]|nr:hypothetical protein J6590_006945 [Homalodisca vitripennis]